MCSKVQPLALDLSCRVPDVGASGSLLRFSRQRDLYIHALHNLMAIATVMRVDDLVLVPQISDGPHVFVMNTIF